MTERPDRHRWVKDMAAHSSPSAYYPVLRRPGSDYGSTSAPLVGHVVDRFPGEGYPQGATVYPYKVEHVIKDMPSINIKAGWTQVVTALVLAASVIFASIASCVNITDAHEQRAYERFEEAKRELKSKGSEARLEAIRSLKSLMVDYPHYRPRIIEELSNYIRVHSGCRDKTLIKAKQPCSPPKEVRAATQAILLPGRRKDVRIDLGGVNLAGVDLTEGDFTGVGLPGADLRRCTLRGADFTNAVLDGADLRGANLIGANVSNVGSAKGVKWPEGFNPGPRSKTRRWFDLGSFLSSG